MIEAGAFETISLQLPSRTQKRFLECKRRRQFGFNSKFEEVPGRATGCLLLGDTMLPIRNDLTIKELAERWRCSSESIHRKIKARLLEGVVRLGERSYLIPVASVEEFERRSTLLGPRGRNAK